MDPRRYLVLAEALTKGVEENAPLTGGSGEEECRSAASRAYYAAFLVARDFLISLNIKVPGSGADHEAVYKGLNNCKLDALEKVAATLSKLRTSRTDADYEMRPNDSDSVTNARVSVDLSTTAIAVIGAIQNPASKPPLDRTQLAKTILDYASKNGVPLTKR